MPENDAEELTNIAKVNGFSCLGTWERDECLKMGRELTVRDCVVRVVPYCEGGKRDWQAKDASDGSANSRSNSNSGRGDYSYSRGSESGGSFFE